MKNTLWKTLIVSLFVTSVMLTACTKNQEEKPANMEEIYREQGIPVRVQNVNYREFVKEIDYSMTVNGLKETPVNAMLADKVLKIKAEIGQEVKLDQVIIEFPQNNVQANYYQAKAAFSLAEQTWQRMQNLFETGGLSQQELDGAETQFKVAQANWDAVQQAVHVKAPISGIITDINVREMQKVGPGDYLFTVSQLKKMFGRVWVSEDDIHLMKKGSTVLFKWNGIEREALISNVALSLNRDFNAFAVEIIIDNDDLVIKSGVTGTAVVEVFRNNSAIVVPRNVVLRDVNNQNFVYIAQNNVAVRRNVKIGNESELNYEIIEGLNVGDRLIVQGLQLVQENSKLNIQSN